MHTQISIKVAVVGIWSPPLFVLGAQGRGVCRLPWAVWAWPHWGAASGPLGVTGP